MGFSRQRQQSEFIIKSKVNIFKKVISIIFTSIMWMYSILVISVFISALFNYNNEFLSIVKIGLNVNNTSIIEFTILCTLFFIISYLFLYMWRFYNKRRYGNLNRRSYPSPATDEDILNLGLIEPIDYKLLQNNKVTVFTENPIIDIDKEDKNYEKAIS